MAQGFSYRGRRYTFAIVGGMTRKLAEEKLTARKRLSTQFLWAIKRVSDGTYGLGRAIRK